MMQSAEQISISKIKRKLFLLGLVKIPMIGFVRPRLVQLDDNKVSVSVKLRRRTRNHLNSMYLGALVVGADIAAGIHVFYFGERLQKRISFAFKSIEGDFIKRAESDVQFVCEDGGKILKMIEDSESSGERINGTVKVSVLNSAMEEVAQFTMGVSVRIK